MRTWDQSKLKDRPDTPPQASQGMHRQCELDLLAEICRRVSGFVVIGCGHGAEFLNLKDSTVCLGIDRLDIDVPHGVEYWKRELFSGITFNQDVIDELCRWRQSFEGPVLWYTDNGYKLAEMAAIAPIMRTDDILGTHDFGTEVPLYSVSFLGEDLVYMDIYDSYIDEHMCMQGFWLRV